MQIKDSRFHKVWEIEDKGNFSKVKLGDSKKDKTAITLIAHGMLYWLEKLSRRT